VKSVKYDNDDKQLTIEREILQEQLITIDENGHASPREYYQYTKYNNQKIYKENASIDVDGDGDGISYFTYTNNSKQYLTDDGKVLQAGEVTSLMYAKRMTDGGNLYSNSAAQYYADAKEFSEWLTLYLGDIEQGNAKDANGNTIEFSTNVGTEKIFEFSPKNNPLVEGSTFDEHRKAVIRKSIETNLLTAIANYNSGSGGTYEFQMPIFTEEDWDKLLNNISISTFMQGVPIKSKYFNNYCVITNNKNEEVVTRETIYVLAENTKTGLVEAHLPTCVDLIDNEHRIIGAYNLIDYERQTIVISEGNEVHYYPKAYQKCYTCIVNISINYEINDIIQGNLNKYNPNTDTYEKIITKNEYVKSLRTTYLKALARERYDLYRTNIDI